MGILDSILGSGVKNAGEGIEASLKGAGTLLKDIRSAITGEISPEKKAEIEIGLTELTKILNQVKASVIIAEIQGQSWLQRNWRPLFMLTIIIIIANNYIFFPYASIFTNKVKMLELPDRLFSLMEIGIGGYIVGRTIEKTRGND